MRAESLIERAAEPLSFSNIAKALLWWAELRSRKETLHSPLGGPAPAADCSYRVREATYAALVGCMVARSPEDLPLDPEVTAERIEALLHYYSSKAAPHPADLEQARKTRNCVRRRMRARGLLMKRS